MKRPFSPRFAFLLLFIFCATFTVKAQTTEWTFVYADGFPHTVWECPGNGGSLQIIPKVAFGATGGLVPVPGTANLVFKIIDRNLFATLTGGKMMGGNFVTQSCVFKAWGYGSFKNDPIQGGSIPGASDTLTATFSEAVAGSAVFLTGRYPQTFIITESGRLPVTVNMNPIYDDSGQVTGSGELAFNLSGKKITGLTVKSTHPSYAFAIDNIKVNRLTPYSPPANNPPPNSCNATAIFRPAPQNVSGYNWTMHSEVTDADGLVLTDIRLKGRLMAERISVPYYNIQPTKQPCNAANYVRMTVTEHCEVD